MSTAKIGLIIRHISEMVRYKKLLLFTIIAGRILAVLGKLLFKSTLLQLQVTC